MLAEPEGFIHTFIDEGAAMGKLLRKVKARGALAGYVEKLLIEVEEDGKDSERRTKEKTMPLVDDPSSIMVEPLTERELQVLRLLRTELSAKEIADELFVAVSTVRSHIKSIYSKLDVHNRLEAISASRNLGLIKD